MTNLTALGGAPVVTAMNSAFARFDQASADLSRAATDGGPQDIGGAVVTQLSAKQAVQASVAVLKTQQEMTKSLLDIKV